MWHIVAPASAVYTGGLVSGGAQLADMHLPVADNPNGSRGRVVAD